MPNKRFTVILTESEHEKLSHLAWLKKTNNSQLIRNLIKKEYEKKQKK